MSWTPKLLAASGLTPEQGVTTGVLLSLGGILGATLLGLLAARFAIHRTLAIFMVITAVLLCFLVGSSGALWVSYTLAFLIGVFVNACVAGLYAIAPVVYGSDVRATGVGWGIGIGRIGAIVSPLVAGACWTRMVTGPVVSGLWPGLCSVGSDCVLAPHCGSIFCRPSLRI